MSSSSSETSRERGRKRRRQQYSLSSSSSSDYSSSESCSPAPPVAARTTVVGRRLNLSREGGVLRRNCQFVKRISVDPALGHHHHQQQQQQHHHHHSGGDRPVYETGDTIAIASDVPTDPREPRNTYSTQMLANCSATALKPVMFLWDAQSKGQPPSRQILLTGLQENVTSKSLLINLISAALGRHVGESIVEVQLTPGVAASLTMKDSAASSALARMLEKGTIGKWNAAFDEEARRYHRLTIKRPSGRPQELRCSRNIPCVLIPYSNISPDESRRVLEDIFRKCRLYNVDRGETFWHVHPLSEGEVGWIWRHRGEFRFRGRGLEMSLELNGKPHICKDSGKDNNGKGNDSKGGGKDNGNGKGNGSTNNSNNSHNTHAQQRSEPVMKQMEPEKKPLLSLSRQESRVSLDALFVRPPPQDTPFVRPPSLDTISIVASSERPAMVTAEGDGGDFLTSLPIFNRRLIERRRAEQAALAKGNIEEMDAMAAQLEQEDSDLVGQAKRQPSKEQARQPLKEQAKQPLKKLLVKKSKRKEDRSGTILAASDASPELRRHESGCARTEGFYKQDPLEKKAVIFFEDVGSKLAQLRTDLGSQGADRSAPSSRSNRAQNRRLQLTLEQVGSDLFGKTTAFAARKKKLILGRSSIHSWGLFAGEDIEAGDLVCEYVGEVIRHTVANVRERHYEMALRAKGSDEVVVASSYFFRLDDMLVVDATHKGSLSRFINHCCEPNCVARILNGERRRIVMYTKRDIRRGEEITYDYKFPLEDDPQKKIKCLCGARACRGYLN